LFFTGDGGLQKEARFQPSVQIREERFRSCATDGLMREIFP
jgi:hypothetical protein